MGLPSRAGCELRSHPPSLVKAQMFGELYLQRPDN